MYSFFIVVLSLLISLYADSYLFQFVHKRRRRRRNTASQCKRVDKLLYTLKYACVLPLKSTHFFLYILSIFPFFTPFCNRQMKVKKKECIEYIRRFKDEETKRHQESSTTFSF